MREAGYESTSQFREASTGISFGYEAADEQEDPSENARPAITNQLIIVHPSRLFRDCLLRSLKLLTSYDIHDFGDAEAAHAAGRLEMSGLIILGLDDGDTDRDLRSLDDVMRLASNTPVIVIASSEQPEFVRRVLKKGAAGYLPSSLALEVSIGAIHVVRAGGIFAPASCILGGAQSDIPPPAKNEGDATFTAKQIAVIQAIRKGKANKTIAYELNMCESTVKVHVRNIMKKLQAKNRTQVAFMANSLLSQDS